MFKVSTTDKAEAMRTGKEYLDSRFYNFINVLKTTKIHRCEYCKTTMKENTNFNYKQKYCSKWCYEMEHLPEIKNTCLDCGIALKPILRNKKSHLSSGTYPKRCRQCKMDRHINLTKAKFGRFSFYKHLNLRLYPELIDIYEEAKKSHTSTKIK